MTAKGARSAVRAVEAGDVLPRQQPLSLWQRFRALLPGGPTPRVLPQFPGVDLASYEQIDPECMAQHLVGPYGGPTRGLPRGEIVLTRITTRNADQLKQVPEECSRRLDERGLHTVLVAVSDAPTDIVEDVADAYDATLLADTEANLPVMLGYLPDVLAEPEREVMTGIGSMTVRQTPIEGRLPGDPELQEDIELGNGEPLVPLAEDLRECDDVQPAITLVAAPPKNYTKAAVSALPDEPRQMLTVRHEPQRIDVVRFYLTDWVPAGDRPGSWSRRSIREEGEPTRYRPDTGRKTPDEGAPRADRTLGDRC